MGNFYLHKKDIVLTVLDMNKIPALSNFLVEILVLRNPSKCLVLTNALRLRLYVVLLAVKLFGTREIVGVIFILRMLLVLVIMIDILVGYFDVLHSLKNETRGVSLYLCSNDACI